MTFIEKQNQYKKVTTNIGWCMIILIATITVGSFLTGVAEEILLFVLDEKIVTVFMGVVNALMYIVYFAVPVLVYFLAFAKEKETKELNMHLEFKLPPRMLLYIVALIGINLVAAMINAILVSPFGFDVIYDLVTPTYPNGFHLYDFILEMIGTALAPAFIEELLFRGLVLALLLPFGKKTAIFGSAILFGFMHQNPAQLIYATVSGIILAIMVIESESVWSGIIAHFLNNAVNVVATSLPYMVGAEKADVISSFLSVVLMGAGLVCAAVIIIKKTAEYKQKKKQELAAKFAELAAKESEERKRAEAEKMKAEQTAKTETVTEEVGSEINPDAVVDTDIAVEPTTDEDTVGAEQDPVTETNVQPKNEDSGEWNAEKQNFDDPTYKARNYSYNNYGVFGQDPFAECDALPKKELIKGFFSKTVIAFLIICAVEMVSLLAVALLMNIGDMMSIFDILEW